MRGEERGKQQDVFFQSILFLFLILFVFFILFLFFDLKMGCKRDEKEGNE
jgi:hypothetical protein